MKILAFSSFRPLVAAAVPLIVLPALPCSLLGQDGAAPGAAPASPLPSASASASASASGLPSPPVAAALPLPSVTASTSSETAAAAVVPPLEARFREGLFAEEAGQDLKKAEAAYRGIIEDFDRDRATVASALYRLGEVHRKEGRAEAAMECFRRVAREFADRGPLARMARENIRLLGGTFPEPGDVAGGAGEGGKNASMPTAVPPVAAATAASPDPEQDKALARLQQMFQTSPDLLLNASTGLKSNGCISYDEAIQAGYGRAVAFFLEHGASADLTPGGKGALALAAEFGHSGLVNLLLDKGADINGQEQAEVPLAAAARQGHLAVVRQLLDRGAEVNGRNEENARVITGVPLVLAAREGHKAVMELLLERGADPGRGRNESLIEVIIHNRPDLAALLLEKGASPDKGRRTLEKNPPQQQDQPQNVSLIPGAARQEAPGPVSDYYLPPEYKGYAKWQPGIRGADTFLPIHLACLGNQPEIVKLLIAKGVDVNAPSGILKSSPLELACVLNLLPLAELLVAAGAKGDVPAPEGLRLIDLGLSHRSVPWYELLKKAGAVVTGVSPGGMSPLEAISLRGPEDDKERAAYQELATRVLNDGAEVNGSSRFRPILHAAVTQNPALVRLLKSKGGDFNPPGGVPPVPALMARVCGKWHEPDKVPEFPTRAAETLEALLDGGADLNGISQRESKSPWLEPEWDGYTALDILAVHLPDVDSLNRFLSFKPMVSTAPERQTPFARALGEYTLLRNFAKLQTAPGRSFVAAVQPSYVVQQSKGGVVAGSVETILKSAPATLRRLWEYEIMGRKPDFGSRVWVQVFDPDKGEGACRFLPASESAAGPVSVAEALAAFGKKECPVPDFTKLEVLARGGEAEGGALVLRRAYDLAALTAASPATPVPVPMLEPGEVLNLHPMNEKLVKSWREFPEPAASWIRTANIRLITVKAGAWSRVFKVVPELGDFRWDPATDVLAVRPTLRTVVRYLPKPEWFYRTDRIAVNEPGDASAGDVAAAASSSSSPAPAPTTAAAAAVPDKWFNLHFPATADKDPVLTSGTVITLEEIPADDPDLVKRKAEGIFVSSPEDGFLREVFRNANPPPGLPDSPVTAMEVVQEFYQKSDCVIPFPDLNSLKFRGNLQDDGALKEPWGGELAVNRTTAAAAEMEKAFHMMELLPATPSLKLEVSLPSGSSRQISLGFSRDSFTRSVDGWHIGPFPASQPNGANEDLSISAPTLQAVSARLFGNRNPDKTRWLKLQSVEKPLAFQPGDPALPFIVLKNGDSFVADPSDREALFSNGAFPPPQSNGKRRIILPTEE